VTVRSFVGFLVWQLHFRHDLPDDAVIFENASVSQQRESLSLGVVYDATAREVFVFRFTGTLAVQPPLFPNVDVAAGMGEVTPYGSAWLSGVLSMTKLPLITQKIPTEDSFFACRVGGWMLAITLVPRSSVQTRPAR
jgi:hypothetical protein